MNTIFKFASLLLAVTLITSCSSDSEKIMQTLAGKWEIKEASRNNKRTSTLEGMYFEFSPEGTLNTNISGQNEIVPFEITDNTIHQLEGALKADYLIESITDSTLELSTEIKKFYFDFVLHKIPAGKKAE